MAVSRQTVHHRKRSCEALQARALLYGLPTLTVTYAPVASGGPGFCWAREGVPLFIGRYQCAHAWLDGYLAGRVC